MKMKPDSKWSHLGTGLKKYGIKSFCITILSSNRQIIYSWVIETVTVV